MGTIHYRPDYAKFLFEVEPDMWHHYYRSLNEAAHTRKYQADWLKSHKVNRLWFNSESGKETWAVDIWGEWAGIVEVLPISWFLALRRFDLRATVWDATEATILDLGQHLQRSITSHNIHVFSTRPATKRLGRDRGGKGFAIGSHKSDLRVSAYKRTREPVAQEFQMKGAYLARFVDIVARSFASDTYTRSAWQALAQLVRDAGEKRLNRVLESAGVGTYWPVIGPQDIPDLPPIQATWIPTLPEEDQAEIRDADL